MRRQTTTITPEAQHPATTTAGAPGPAATAEPGGHSPGTPARTPHPAVPGPCGLPAALHAHATVPAGAGRAAALAATRTARRPAGPGGPARPTVPGQGAPGGRPGRPGRGAATRRELPVHTAFAERLLAVLSGERPVHSMLGLTVGEAYEQLVRLAPRTVPRGLGARPVLRRCAAQPHSGDTVLEVFASLAAGHRVRALAFRLERGHDHRWRCAAVELDGLGRLVGGGAQP
ncbi:MULTISPECIES: Rv3235 family protein [unclassified Streptomyces]|uniref:Rv3235 family protein n=1 Tax=unclassified Streptomyces TaxID=2593676 RepID=UPI0036FBF830